MHTQLSIRTTDGTVTTELFDGKGPGVLFFHDGLGMRPAMHELGTRLASHGYTVLMPDLFYRMAPYDPPNPAALFSDPAVMAAWWAKAQTNTAEAILRDTKFYIDELRTRSPNKIGATGYCMGGRLALSAAGTYPDYFAAVAAYHPGRLVTDQPDSPHKLASSIKADVYIAAATDDPSFPVEHQEQLVAALTAGNVPHIFETYPAKHGWVPSDTPVHDAGCAERHWSTLLGLFSRCLR